MSAPAVAALLAARTAAWTAAERAALDQVVAALRPSARHLTDVLDWLDDVAVRDGVRPAAVLARPGLEAQLRARGSAPDLLKRWKEVLRRERYPRLAAREDALAATVRGLGLGRAVRVQPPAALEGGVVTFTIAARSADELAEVLERLHAALAAGRIEALFALLD